MRNSAAVYHRPQPALPPHVHLSAHPVSRAGSGQRGRDGSRVAQSQDLFDDRRVHGCQRRRKGVDEDVELARSSSQVSFLFEFLNFKNLPICSYSQYLSYSYVGDCQMSLALQKFLNVHGEELLQRNLYRNFILHLCNLYDFGIIGPATVLRTIGAVQRIMHQNPQVHNALTQAWLSQLPKPSQS